MVERIYTGVKQRRPEVVVSVAVFPDARESFTYRYQDWEGWLRAGFVDVVVPMAYNPDDERFDEAISRAAAVAGPDRIWAGVGTHLGRHNGRSAPSRRGRIGNAPPGRDCDPENRPRA